jgi:hypothetical protein
MSNTARNAIALLKEQRAPRNEKSLYYKKLVTKRDLYTLRQKFYYFESQTARGNGVTGAFIRKLRESVLIYLGGESFKYLEQMIDARDYAWRLSSSFSWEKIERLGMTRGYTRKTK